MKKHIKTKTKKMIYKNKHGTKETCEITKYNEQGILIYTKTNNCITEMTYNTHGDICQKKNRFSDGSEYVKKYIYDELNRLVKTANTDGINTDYEYFEDTDKLLTVKGNDGYYEIYHYDEAGNEIYKNIEGNVVQKIYDKNNQVIYSKDDLYSYLYEYNDSGKIVVKKIYDEKWKLISHYESIYNERNEIVKVIDVTNGINIIHGYDSNGNHVYTETETMKTMTVFNEQNNILSTEYRMKICDKWVSDISQFEYDASGTHVLKSKTLGGEESRYVYDENFNVVEEYLQDKLIIEQRFDGYNNCIYKKNYENNTETYISYEYYET